LFVANCFIVEISDNGLMYDLENFHGKWKSFAAEDRILFCCPSEGTE